MGSPKNAHSRVISTHPRGDHVKVKTMKKAIAAAFALALVAPFGLGNQASAKDGEIGRAHV